MQTESLILFLIILISYSYQSCKEGKNFCILCELSTDLCKQCESEIFKPDKKGGCEGSKICKKNDNYCIECKNSTQCETCELGFFPDSNGGCSNVENCEISENGICRKCMDNFALIYKGKSYLECVSLNNNEELLNCEEYDTYGHCLKCKENYFMNAGDKKCSKTNNCLYSSNGICDICDYDYYLDKNNKTNYLCILNNGTNTLWKCIFSENGKTCDECLFPYFLSKNNFCVKNINCTLGDLNLGKCLKCSEDLYLSSDNYSCTTSDLCITGYMHNNKCKLCKNGFYTNLTDGNCYSNTENNDQKYCVTFSEKCESCEENYFLGEDNKCSSSKNCLKSEYGNCTQCIQGYYLGKDNKCTKVEHCAKANFNYQCEDCDDNFFLYQGNCYNDDIKGNTFKNCKVVYSGLDHCSECKINYYIDEADYLCHDNTNVDNNFYRCSHVIKNSQGNKVCNACEYPYYLTEKDLKCISIPGCAETDSSSTQCKECISGMCHDIRAGTCQDNSILDEEEENPVCYRCIETSPSGSNCNKCEEGYSLSSLKFCIDDSLCAKKESNKCVECKQNVKLNEEVKSFCLNEFFGCIESIEGCLTCDDYFHPENCTKCLKGYYLDEYFNFCNECKEGCDSCTDWDDCGGCKEEGYYTIKESSGKEKYDAECGACSEGCKICTDDLNCEVCYSGYYLNNKNRENRMRCNQCSTFCEQCLDDTYCLKCMEGFQLVFDKDNIICEYKNNNTDEMYFQDK